MYQNLTEVIFSLSGIISQGAILPVDCHPVLTTLVIIQIIIILLHIAGSLI